MLVGHRFGTKVVAGGKIDLAGGKIISRGREIILSRGKNSLAGGKSFLKKFLKSLYPAEQSAEGTSENVRSFFLPN